MTKRCKWLPIMVLCLSAAMSSAPYAQSSGNPIPSESPHEGTAIHYKTDLGTNAGTLVMRVAGALLLVTGLAFGIALVARRYMPAVRGYSMDGRNRIQLLESRRITPRLTLFAVAFDGKTLLLAQCGDHVVDIGVAGRGSAVDTSSSSS